MVRSSGWRYDSHRHALAAKGIRTKMVDPIFFAQKKEQSVPFGVVMELVRGGATAQDLVKEFPDADEIEVRNRGVKAIESTEGDNTLGMMVDNKYGVDHLTNIAERDPVARERMRECLRNHQKRSYVHPEKAAALQRRLDAMGGSA